MSAGTGTANNAIAQGGATGLGAGAAVSAGVGVVDNASAVGGSSGAGRGALVDGSGGTAANAFAFGGNLGAGVGATVSGVSVQTAIAMGGNTGVGAGARATGIAANSVALGGSTGAGAGASTAGLNSLAFGGTSGAVAGARTPAAAVAGTAIGASDGALVGATAAGARGTAIGTAANSNTGADNIALGTSSNAGTGSGNTAIGKGATINAGINGGSNQQMFGTAANSYTMAGINGTSTAAQQGGVKLVTADANGTLGVTTLALPPAGASFATSNDINRLQNQIDGLAQEDRRLRAGIAMASAVPSTLVLPGENFALDASWSNYAGANALGVGSAVRIGQLNLGGGSPVFVQGNAGAAFSPDGGGNRAVVRAGVRLSW